MLESQLRASCPSRPCGRLRAAASFVARPCGDGIGGGRAISVCSAAMLEKSNLFLVGPMGSGKSAVGKQLARMLRMPFYDSDIEIERRTGVAIPYIFEKEGEAGFRQRERETLEILTAMENIVLATGGGAVLLPENRSM